MALDDGALSHYPCLTQKDGLRRVLEPRDERLAPQSPLRWSWPRLVMALRR